MLKEAQAIGHGHCPRCGRCLTGSAVCLEYHPAQVAPPVVPFKPERLEAFTPVVLDVACTTCFASVGESCKDDSEDGLMTIGNDGPAHWGRWLDWKDGLKKRSRH